MSRFRSPRGRRPARSARVVVAPSGRQLVYLNADASGIVQAYIENADGSDAQLDHRLRAAHAGGGLGGGELMRRLLFLIADTGGGHRAAATAVERQMTAASPGEFEITILDPFTSAKPKVIGGTAGLYGPITRHARWLWGGLYHSTNSRPAVALLERTVLRSVTSAVTEAIDQLDPACVVSFHPLLNHISVRAVRSRTPRIPVVTVITDLVDIHVAWECRDVDAVVVPSPGGLDHCRRAGIPASRCHDFGLAVDRKFTELPGDPAGIAAIRRGLGLRTDSFVGARLRWRGRLGRDRQARAGDRRRLARPRRGRDLRPQRARANGPRRPATGAGRAVRVLGYVDNMAEWMRACDVVVSKAGPGTIAEALCCGLPLLLVWYLPGQERGNVEWVVDIGAGRYVPRDEQLVDAVAELAEPGSGGSGDNARSREGSRPAGRHASHRRVDRLDGRSHQRERRRPDSGRALGACGNSSAHGARSCASGSTDFATTAEATVRFGPGLNVIHGQNAQGKTNLLEAIATLRSHEVATDNEQRRSAAVGPRMPHSPRPMSRVHRPTSPCPSDFSVTSQPDAWRGSRQSTASRAPARAMLGVCPVVLFWPEDLALVRGGPEGRRRFLDVILAQTDRSRSRTCPDTGACSSSATRCCISCVLGTGARDSLQASRASSPITAHGSALARARLVDALAPLAALSLHDLSGQRERIALRYAPAHVDAVAGTVEAAEQALLETLAPARWKRSPAASPSRARTAMTSPSTSTVARREGTRRKVSSEASCSRASSRRSTTSRTRRVSLRSSFSTTC